MANPREIARLRRALGARAAIVPGQPRSLGGKPTTLGEQISALEAEIRRLDKEMLEAGWTQAEIDAMKPEPMDEDEALQEIQRLVEEMKAEGSGGFPSDV